MKISNIIITDVISYFTFPLSLENHQAKAILHHKLIPWQFSRSSF